MLAEMLAQAQGPVLDRDISLLTDELHAHSATRSNEQASTLIRLIAHLDARREEAELAADPARRVGS